MFLEKTPNVGEAVVGAGLVFSVYYAVCAVYNIFFHPLSKFSGPPISHFSRMPLIRAHFKGKLHEWINGVHEKYGPIVRIAPNELSTTLPGAWKDIYQSRPFLPKDPNSLTPPLNGADSLFTAIGDTHGRIRRVFSQAFSDKALREQSPAIEDQIHGFIRRVRREAATSIHGEVDISRFYGYVALDVVGELVFGESFHSLDQDAENNLIRSLALGAKFGSLRTSMSRFHPLEIIVGWIALRMTSKQREKNWSVMHGWLDHRLQMGSLGTGRSDIVTPVIGNIDNGKKDSISRAELDTNAGAMAMAGSGLPAVALTAATYFLLRHPEKLRHLTNEVRSTFKTQEEINVASTHNLPYLEAVIMETLRIHHPTPSYLPRLVPQEGRSICGQYIPGGSVIGVSLHAIHTSPSNWTEPFTWHPERWLTEKHPQYDARFNSDAKDAFRPFSCGPQNCMGTNIFLAESRVILSRMVFSFDLEAVNPEDEAWPDQRAYLIYEMKPLMVRLKERDY